MKNKSLNSILFIIGYILSPFTWWNDTFINIPIAYFFASIFFNFGKTAFLRGLILFYWLTNIAGIILMYISSKDFLNNKIKGQKLLTLVFDIVLYTLLIGVLVYFNVVKPIKF